MDKVTVITVVYNDVVHIEETIKSVLSQAYKNIEYIIIDGASTDGTLEICKRYEDKIAKIISEPDLGIYNAMNKGVNLASGKWVFFLNSGDLFYDENVLSDVFQSEFDADIVYGKAMTSDGQLCYYPKKISFLMFVLERMVCHQAIFAKIDSFENNNFDENYRIIADRVWLYKCYKAHMRFHRKNIIISKYDTNGISSNKNKFDIESLRFLRSLSLLLYWFGKCKRKLHDRLENKDS